MAEATEATCRRELELEIPAEEVSKAMAREIFGDTPPSPDSAKVKRPSL